MFEGPEDDPTDGALLELRPGVSGILLLVPAIGVALVLVGFGLDIPSVVFLGLLIMMISSLLLYWSYSGLSRPYLLGMSPSEGYPAPSSHWHHQPGPYHGSAYAPHAQAVAPGRCQTCGGTLHYGKLFCPQCSAPIFRTGPEGPGPPEL